METNNTVLMWISGLVAGAYLLLLNWLYTSIVREKKLTAWRVDEIYKRIKKAEEETQHCRQDIEKQMSVHMTEPQIKDFVDRSVRPLKEAVDGVKQTLVDIEKTNSQIHSDVRVLNTLVTKLVEKN